MTRRGESRVVSTDNTLLNAVIGAVATFGLSFTGISPVLGGALAAYLEGGETADGLRIGTLSGLIASLPLGLLVVAGFVLFGFAGTGAAIGGIALLIVGVTLVAGYIVALSALGGVIGIYLKGEL